MVDTCSSSKIYIDFQSRYASQRRLTLASCTHPHHHRYVLNKDGIRANPSGVFLRSSVVPYVPLWDPKVCKVWGKRTILSSTVEAKLASKLTASSNNNTVWAAFTSDTVHEQCVTLMGYNCGFYISVRRRKLNEDLKKNNNSYERNVNKAPGSDTLPVVLLLQKRKPRPFRSNLWPILLKH